MTNNRTPYKIRNEKGEITTITLDKLVADVLQKSLPDVHAWIQNTYDRLGVIKPELGRRKKGDLVRQLSLIEAEKSPCYNELIANQF